MKARARGRLESTAKTEETYRQELRINATPQTKQLTERGQSIPLSSEIPNASTRAWIEWLTNPISMRVLGWLLAVALSLASCIWYAATIYKNLDNVREDVTDLKKKTDKLNETSIQHGERLNFLWETITSGTASTSKKATGKDN